MFQRKLDVKLILEQEAYLGYHNGSLSSMGFMEFNHFFEWILTDNITVKHKKWLTRIIYQFVPSQSQRTSSA